MRSNSERRLRRLALAVTVAVGLAAPALAAGDDYVRVKVDTANVRGGPGTRHELLWQVEENFPLKVLERRRHWLRTEDVLGDEGWVFAPLTDGKPAVAVDVDLANVRTGPGRRHPVRYQAERGASFLLLDEKGPWLRVEHADRGPGWIHKNLVWGDVD